MNTFSNTFNKLPHVPVEIIMPSRAIEILSCITEIMAPRQKCVGGGFLRGLYMRDVMGLSPEMNDIDVFMDIEIADYCSAAPSLEEKFGKPVRFHRGRFEETDAIERALVEFDIPEQERPSCAGVKSAQLNFGPNHPWADAQSFVKAANLGINQIAYNPETSCVIASAQFMKDMTEKTITMNSDRVWTINDWRRTVKSMNRFVKERPEFKGWKTITVPEPQHISAGSFWCQRSNKESFDIKLM